MESLNNQNTIVQGQAETLYRTIKTIERRDKRIVMTKMNFDNKLEDDDKHLVQLLRGEVKDFPSDQLVERTMTRISAMHAVKKLAHRPLRIPIYIMMAIALLLLAPFIVPMVPNGSSLGPLSEFLSHPESSILKYTIWCWLAFVVFWITEILFQVQSKFDLNPFKL